MAKKTWEDKFDKWVAKNRNFPTLEPSSGPMKRWDKWLGSDVDIPGFDDDVTQISGGPGSLTGLSGMTVAPMMSWGDIWD
jgi:hypothetical protein